MSMSASPVLLAISFAYPPLAYPRSAQVARLLRHLSDFSVRLVCADEQGARRDPSLEPDGEALLDGCVRVPFSLPKWRLLVGKMASDLQIPLLDKSPDRYRSWQASVLSAIHREISIEHRVPDVLITFGQPMTDHVIGLEAKRRYHLPWIAHFSDPWVDNPYNRYDPLTWAANRQMEARVIGGADRLIFTSQETVDLVMGKYPEGWRAKAKVVPHCFDANCYPKPDGRSGCHLSIRHLGNLYENRSPKPLLMALKWLSVSAPEALKGVRFELVGAISRESLEDLRRDQISSDLVDIKQPVGYEESLRLMIQADGLLVIDAPSDRSVFLPSKLVDYIGAGRPILGITPQGASAALIHRLGGWAADPSDVRQVAEALQLFLRYLRQTAADHVPLWGDPSVRREYHASSVAESFASIVNEVLMEDDK